MTHYYSRADWRERRAEVIARQPVCATPGCGRPSAHVHHNTRRRAGGSDDDTTAYCQSCHNRITASGERVPAGAPGCDAKGYPLDPGHWWYSPHDAGRAPTRPETPDVGEPADAPVGRLRPPGVPDAHAKRPAGAAPTRTATKSRVTTVTKSRRRR